MAIDRVKINASAEKFVKSGKLPEAIAEYKRLVEDNSRDMGVLNKLGDLCVRAGKNHDAMRYFLRIAEFYAADGFFLKAIAMYKKVSKFDAANLDIQQKLAGLYQQQGLTIEAKAQYLAVADRQIKAGQFKKACEVFPRILEIEPDNVKARMSYADLLIKVGSPADAGREFRQVAQDLAKKGMLDEAIRMAQKGAKVVPGDADTMSLILALTKEAEKSPGDLLATVEQMAKSNGENPRSLALLGEAYLAAGKTAQAEKVFAKLRGMENAPPEVAAAVTRFHVSKNDANAALEWVIRAADGYAASGRMGDGAGILDEFLRALPGNLDALRKRAAIAELAGDKNAQIEALAALAEALSAKGERSEAASIVERLVELDPQNPKHATMLARMKDGKTSRAAPPPERPAEEVVPLQSVPAHGIPVADIQEGALDLEQEPTIEIGSETVEVASGGDALGGTDDEIAAGPQSKIQEMADEPNEEGEEAEDDDFISEHFTEAEVFVKYGLLDKAKEQLLNILGKYPKHVASHGKLKEIYYEEGDKEKAVGECLSLATILKSKNRAEEAQDFVNEAIRIDPNNPKVKEFTAPPVQAPPRKATPAPPAAPAPPKPTPVAAAKPPVQAPVKRVVVEPEPTPELELEEISSDEALEIEPATTGEDPKMIAEASDADLELEIEMPEEPAPKPAPKVAAVKPAAAKEPATKARQEKVPEKIEEETPEDLGLGLSLGDLGDDISIEMDEDSEAVTPSGGDSPAQPMAAAVGARDPDPEKLGEVDFYIDQGLLEEARAVLFQLQKQHPGSQEVSQRFERANRPPAVDPTPAPSPQPAAKPALDLEVERAFGAKTMVLPARRPESEPAPRASKATPVFKVEKQKAPAEEEGDFFDLAGELDRSLAEAQVAVETPDEAAVMDSAGHSIDEIFKAFKKGVEQQVDSHDYETHYNLGIAYKEMGLVDEAIGEFQYAARDASKTVECCEILGLCFREKGMPQLALKWYQKGLDLPNLGEHESVGLRYDIAEVHREQGDYKKAMQMYTEVYGLDSTYRDVSAKIKEMKKLLG